MLELVEESILADLARAHSRRTLKDGTESTSARTTSGASSSHSVDKWMAGWSSSTLCSSTDTATARRLRADLGRRRRPRRGARRTGRVVPGAQFSRVEAGGSPAFGRAGRALHRVRETDRHDGRDRAIGPGEALGRPFGDAYREDRCLRCNAARCGLRQPDSQRPIRSNSGTDG